ncbi:SRPBCC family protein [Malonomonas rubra]|uniref:SRPBCC family protein n=1 Tax=Malonomonas rubra TaxID=57040 RepID=UPI0026E93F16|nr:SRPBCC family protein [Malonomonas rubra]
MYCLEREIILNATKEQVWEFMATPANLNELTPPDLHFQILSDLPETMYNGLLILYAIRIPLFGTRRWLTEIKHIREGESFVDEQRLGPYRYWYHQHWVEPVGAAQTRMTDRVTYQLPFGLVGRLVHKIWVKQMLTDIFAYRAEMLKARFGTKK